MEQNVKHIKTSILEATAMGTGCVASIYHDTIHIAESESITSTSKETERQTYPRLQQ